MSPQAIAQRILDGFTNHYRLFQSITARAPLAFAQRDWETMREIASLRISYYDTRVNETVEALAKQVSDPAHAPTTWTQTKFCYQEFLAFHPQAELAETFYNSVFCRLFERKYYNNDFIFVKATLADAPALPVEAEYRSYFPVTQGLKPTIRQIITQFEFGCEFVNLERDIRLLLKAFIKQAPETHVKSYQMRFDILQAPFYRGQAAYIVGRVVSAHGSQPFIIAVLHNKNKGLYIDALLTRSSQMRVIFGFARAYFMVQTHAPSALVHFLNQLMPGKTKAELYNAIGFHKQGKTEFYRELLEHMQHTRERFELAAGTPGMVMMVINLPSFPYVFKIIRDKFGSSKPFGRSTVLARYQLVKRHDRVGRMADTLEYSDVALPLSSFSDELLLTLNSSIANSLRIEDGMLIIKHLYIERRMTPLNLYLQEVDVERTEDAIKEYGQALKDMIAANIFPGDMLLKNFGVTKHRRVVFYDYDEVQYLTDMQFRELDGVDEMTVSVAPNDVFPAQLTTFVLPNAQHKETFLKYHPELIDAEYWRNAQRKILQGEYKQVYPYPQEQRFIHLW
ncbi:bifunctional isocitrate dehydrogenase kinase/phosphatase [Pseudoalteromonas sp. SSDWG2]|uniref:bifunctional isocitrate dehydrogenase kinase/phosphatase n=1 Tax=Pseudoalteromonas sp. SSDWG2 TaxID=3139391 RepID=UPI003BAD2B56